MIKKKIKLKFSGFLFLLSCVVVFILSLFLFWKNLNRATIRSDKEQIGIIQYKYKIAQRKFSDRIAWERLQQNAPLYNEDTIRTADGASATLIIDEAKIELHESTMIQIVYSPDGGVKLSVDSGDISIDTTAATKDLSIDFSNGQSFILESGSKISAQAGQVNNLMVQSGIVNYIDETGSVTQIQGGETVRIAENGKVDKVPVSVTSVTENVHLLSFDHSPKNVLLQWNTNDASQNVPVIVETSLTKDFSTITESYKVTDGTSVNVQSPVGKLYWRVYLENEKENCVDGKITVENVDDIVLLTPGLNQQYESREGTSNVNFSWKGNSQVAYYLFEVSHSSDFTNPFVSQQIYSTYTNIGNLEKGDYYWRVTPYYLTGNYGYGKTSEINNFEIKKLEFDKPPVLSAPANNSKITVYDSGTDITFLWKNLSSAVKYNLQIASDSSFNNIIYSKECSETRLNETFTSDLLKNGSYYWKVISLEQVDSNGNKLESDVRSFSTAKYIPGENKLVYPPNNFTVEEDNLKNITFSWKIAEENKSTVSNSYLQISKNSDFSDLVVNKKTSDTWINDIKTSDGNFWWRVAFDKNDGSTVYTTSSTINVLKKLNKPEFTYPEMGSTVVLEKENTVSIKWKELEGVDYYSIKVFDGDKLINNVTSRSTSTKFNLNESMVTTTGKDLKVTLQGIASASEKSSLRESPITQSIFTVRKPQKTLIRLPENGSKLEGLTALRNPVEFKWNNSPDAEKVTFVLRKMQPSGEMLTIKNMENPGASTSISGLTSGTYEWTVKAISKDGYNLDSEQTYGFTILPIPELAGARLITPTPNQIIDSDYLLNNKSINFTWRQVSGATDYKFVLYQRLSNGKLKKIVSKDTKKTEYKMTDLTSLDVGNFEWQIIAYVHSTDGREEQKSRAAVGKFKIDFGIPTEVEVIDPGVLYGE